jgi:hypothetical protein
VVDGYGGASGPYELNVYCEVCETECPWWMAVAEGEPDMVNEYVDVINGGCNSNPPVFQNIDWVAQEDNCGWVCATTGWYYFGGQLYRDTDWYSVTAASTFMRWEVYTVEPHPVAMYVLAPDYTCTDIEILQSAQTGDPPECYGLIELLDAIPGQEYWLWVGPTFEPPTTVPYTYEYYL